jgi:hypothetical protein
VAPRNFDAFFAKKQKKTVKIPAVPCRQGRGGTLLTSVARVVLLNAGRDEETASLEIEQRNLV